MLISGQGMDLPGRIFVIVNIKIAALDSPG